MKKWVFIVFLFLTNSFIFADLPSCEDIRQQLIEVYKMTVSVENLPYIQEVAKASLTEAKGLLEKDTKNQNLKILTAGIEEILKTSDLEQIKSKADELILLIRS